MLPAFRLGLGAAIGNGAHRFPIVSLPDWCRAVEFGLTTDFAGPMNIAMPQAPTNAEFTQALGRELHRPTFLRIPATAVKLGFGSLAPSLLGSVRLHPQRLLDAGFTFQHAELASVLEDALHR